MQRGCVGECDANKLLQQVPSWNRVLAVAKVRLGGGSVKHIPKLNTESSGIAQQRLETQCAFEHQSYVHLDDNNIIYIYITYLGISHETACYNATLCAGA